VLLAVIPVVAVTFFAVLYALTMLCLYNPPKYRCDHERLPDFEPYISSGEACRELIRALEAVPCEEIEIINRSGMRLRGRYYPGKPGAPVAICFHGYKGTALRDFCGGARLLRKLGHHVVLVDQRAQGRSDGRFMTFGILERYDCLDWVSAAVERFGADTSICLYGVSMGASTVVMAAGLELPPQVKAVVADCPYSSPRDIIESVIRGMRLPAKPLCAMIALGARLFAGFKLDAATAAQAASAAKIPILLIHGEADGFVPCEMSKTIAEANPAMVRRETFPNAQHGYSFMADRPRYEAIVTEFLTGVL